MLSRFGEAGLEGVALGVLASGELELFLDEAAVGVEVDVSEVAAGAGGVVPGGVRCGGSAGVTAGSLCEYAADLPARCGFFFC